MNIPLVVYALFEQKYDVPYEEIYQRKLAEASKYHYEHGQYGFLSERTYKENIPSKAKCETELEIQMNTIPKTVPIEFEDIIDVKYVEEKTKEVEAMEGFVKWIEEPKALCIREILSNMELF